MSNGWLANIQTNGGLVPWRMFAPCAFDQMVFIVNE